MPTREELEWIKHVRWALKFAQVHHLPGPFTGRVQLLERPTVPDSKAQGVCIYNGEGKSCIVISLEGAFGFLHKRRRAQWVIDTIERLQTDPPKPPKLKPET